MPAPSANVLIGHLVGSGAIPRGAERIRRGTVEWPSRGLVHRVTVMKTRSDRLWWRCFVLHGDPFLGGDVHQGGFGIHTTVGPADAGEHDSDDRLPRWPTSPSEGRASAAGLAEAVAAAGVVVRDRRDLCELTMEAEDVTRGLVRVLVTDRGYAGRLMEALAIAHHDGFPDLEEQVRHTLREAPQATDESGSMTLLAEARYWARQRHRSSGLLIDLPDERR